MPRKSKMRLYSYHAPISLPQDTRSAAASFSWFTRGYFVRVIRWGSSPMPRYRRIWNTYYDGFRTSSIFWCLAIARRYATIALIAAR